LTHKGMKYKTWMVKHKELFKYVRLINEKARFEISTVLTLKDSGRVGCYSV